MIARLVRIGVALTVIVAAYGAYALTVVPLIEPRSRRVATTGPTKDQLQQADRALIRQREDLRQWFVDGDWELRSSKVIETPKGTLLFEKYRNLGRGRIELTPCTMVLLPHGDVDDADRRREAIIMRAPEGAVLQFDEGFDLSRGQFGQLHAGRLSGPITVRSDQKLPGPDDDLEIDTQDIELAGNRITTVHPIQFRLGPHQGSGRELSIDLEATTDKKQKTGLAISGIRALELRRDVRMNLLMPGKGLLPRSDEPSSEELAASDEPPAGQPVNVSCLGAFRFDLRSYLATFRDAVHVVRFNTDSPSDQLQCELLSIHFSTGQRGAAPVAGGAGKSSKLTPDWLEARGSPVTVSAPAMEVQARGQVLKYNLVKKGVSLTDPHEAIVSRGADELRGRELYYEPGPASPFGIFSAVGPGWIRGRVPDKKQRLAQPPKDAAGQPGERGDEPSAARTFEARWSRSMRFRPHDGRHVLSIDGSAHVADSEMGGLDAGVIHVWLKESAVESAPGERSVHELTAHGGRQQSKLVPERMLADGQVVIRTQALSGSANSLKAWILADRGAYPRPAAEGPPATAAGPQPVRNFKPAIKQIAHHSGAAFQLLPGAVGQSPRPYRTHEVTVPRSGAAPSQFHRFGVPVPELPLELTPNSPPPVPPPGPPRGTLIDTGPWRQPPAETNDTAAGESPAEQRLQTIPPVGEFAHDGAADKSQRFHIDAETLQVELLLSGGQMQLSRANAVNNVVLYEVQTTRPEDQPLQIRGQELFLEQVSPGAVVATIAGQPAHVEGRGMTLDGQQIRLDRTANRLEIDRAGNMRMPVDRDMEGRRTAQPQMLELAWQGGLMFDGLKAQMRGDVVAKTAGQTLATPLMEVFFQERVDFSHPQQAAQRPQLARVACSGGVLLDRVAFDAQGRQADERIKVEQLSVDQLSGALKANGAGWVRAVHRGNGSLGGLPVPGGKPAAAPTGGAGLSFLGVRFQRGIVGNFHHKELTFQGQVKAVYGPVLDWESSLEPDEDPSRLPPGSLNINCENLNVVQMPGAAKTDPPQVELMAAGNAIAETVDFTARADKIKYAQAKQTLSLEGDGLASASLERQQGFAGPQQRIAARKFTYFLSTGNWKIHDGTGFDTGVIPGK